MKILTIHSDYLNVEAKSKAIKSAEELKEKEQKFKDSLVVFISVEKTDEENKDGAAINLCKQVLDVASQVKEKNIVLYPFVHLSSNPGSPDAAVEILKKAKENLSKEEGLHVEQVPFGWYKGFEIKCKGHPLSELSREFGPAESKKKEKPVLKDQSFVIEKKNPTDKEKVMLSSAFVVASAVKEMFPEADFGIIGMHNEKAFVDVSGIEFKKGDIERIDQKARQIINKKLPFENVAITDIHGKYQKEIADDLGVYASAFSLNNLVMIPLFKDCFVLSTKEVAAFKIFNELSSAYWKNNSSNHQLVRLYSAGFGSKAELEDYLKLIDEAEKRDHRKLGQQLGLFSIHDEAPGMPFFHDKGNFIFGKLVDFMTSEMRKLGYEINRTPIILNKALWLQSGHWDHYKENMYFTKIDDKDFAVKPMNCPGNILVFKSDVHSYRELPIKAGEFGLVHRHELSGVLSGLFRVRAFTQDDAHVFCTEEQISEQIIELIDLVGRIYSTFGFEYEVELSTKPEKAMGDPKKWEFAEKALANALEVKKLKYKLNPGEGAFYGPKIDFHVKDAVGRKWQCGTIQLDFSMPEKFDLTYEGADGKKHRPVMLHRAIYGSLERFLGILIEHFAGKFPLWLSPVQLRIVTVSDKHNDFAKEILKKLKDDGFRAEFDERAGTVNKKIRDAQMEKVNYLITLGDKEKENGTLAIRARDGSVKFGVKIDEFITGLKAEIDKKEIR